MRVPPCPVGRVLPQEVEDDDDREDDDEGEGSVVVHAAPRTITEVLSYHALSDDEENPMAKMVDNTVLDGAFNIVNDATVMVVCSTQPANHAGLAAVSLADVAMTSGDFTIADAAGGGRQVTVAAKSGVTIDTSGTAGHVALDNGTTLLYVTTCTSQALTAAGTVNIPAWIITIGDPT